MNNRQRYEQLAIELRKQEVSRLATEFFAWAGNVLRIRHEAALRERTDTIPFPSANAMPA